MRKTHRQLFLLFMRKEINSRLRSGRRLGVFRFLAVLLPFVFLLLVEMALRVLGYGHDLRLFVEDPQHEGYLVMNRYVSERYFNEIENATIGNFEPFRAEKTEGTFRIFVLGESTTIGYPYFHNGSFHRWLHYRLMHTFPDRDFEIINLALTAVNSHTVYDMGREIADYAPDAVMVYVGHNEYYGALGIGSTSSLGHYVGLVRLLVRLRHLRLVQLLGNLVNGIKKMVSGNAVDIRENLMKRMAAKQQISFGSDEYKEGIAQFDRNLTDLCQLLADRQIPVFISDLVSNEKDLKPFISAPGDPFLSAQVQYEAAQKAFDQNNFNRSKKDFIRAKDLDMLRFRAPEAMNGIIQELPSRFSNVTLVHARKTFERHSLHGILGDETLLEHVHPNLFGYALLSDAFYRALTQKQGWKARKTTELSLEQLYRQMPITAVDSLAGAYEVSILKEGWPFNQPMSRAKKGPKTSEEQLAGALVVKQITWPEAMNQLLIGYTQKNQPADALRVAEALVLEYPFDPSFSEQAGKLSLNLLKNDLAITYLKRAFRQNVNPATAQRLFVVLLKADEPEGAFPYLRIAAAANGNPPALTGLIKIVERIIGLKKQNVEETNSVQLYNELAAGYLQFANATAARKYVEKTLKLDPLNSVALSMRLKIQSLESEGSITK